MQKDSEDKVLRVTNIFQSPEEVAFRIGEWVGHYDEEHQGQDGYEIRGFGFETIFVREPGEQAWVPLHTGFQPFEPTQKEVEEEFKKRRKGGSGFRLVDPAERATDGVSREELRKMTWEKQGIEKHPEMRFSDEQMKELSGVYPYRGLFSHWEQGYGDVNFCVCLMDRKAEHSDIGSIAELREYQKRAIGTSRWLRAEEEVLRRVLMNEEPADEDAERAIRGDSA